MHSLRFVTLVLGIVVLSIGAASGVPPALLRSDAPALEITTSILPVTEDPYQLLKRAKPGMYRCSVLVHDEPGSNRVWGTKDILLSPGEHGEETSEFGQLRLHFRAKVAQASDRADTVVTVTRDGRVVSRQSSTVWLQR